MNKLACENRPVISGTACCLVAALAYTASNVCMRQLTAMRCDPFWAVFNKELVAVVAVGPWLLCRAIRGRPTLPSRRTLGLLLAVGLLVELVGNVGIQWSLGVVGLAVTIPAVSGMMILSGAALGHVWLGEWVSIRSAAAIAVLVASLVFLGLGAEAAGKSIAVAEAVAPSLLIIALAVAAAGTTGAIYALLSAVIRHSVTRATPPSTVAFLVPLMAVFSVGPIGVYRLGVQAALSTPWEQLLLMAAAGVFNLIGFLGLIHGLQRTTVIRANVLTASQVAMAALAGMALFHEPPNHWVLLGGGLTILGIVWIDRPAEAIEEILPP